MLPCCTDVCEFSMPTLADAVLDKAGKECQVRLLLVGQARETSGSVVRCTAWAKPTQSALLAPSSAASRTTGQYRNKLNFASPLPPAECQNPSPLFSSHSTALRRGQLRFVRQAGRRLLRRLWLVSCILKITFHLFKHAWLDWTV